MDPDNAAPLILAARQRRELARAKAVRALREIDRAGTPVTFQTVARAALLTELCLEFQQFSG
jgi:hypothetical protein